MSAQSCRLYLFLAAGAPACRTREDLLRILDAGDIACILLLSGEDRPPDSLDAQAITAIAQTRDIAVVVENDPERANEIQADGVHLTGGLDNYDESRRLLPADGIVGVHAANSRHLAMEAGERGADYIAMPADDEDMVAWWTSIFEVPCVAVAGADLDSARRAIRQGAEFVAIDGTAWADSGGAGRAIADLNRLIGEIGAETVE